MAAFTKGDIVLFPFPYTDLSNRKLRPCLAISEEMNEDIILCQITSKEIGQDKYSVELKSSETLNGSLQIDSYVRTNMIFTASKKQIVKKICNMNNKRYDQVAQKIISLISRS